ncbi:MAG TPA: zinc-ribbon domain-containing protein, partial [Acidimicrobiales bacterium]|nr:zinc-ribbon domain-containing protein [Acidimicrobiales bacterium]
MRCVTCGAELPPDSQFCEDCGAPVAAQCPSCGAAVAAGKAFCRVCGTRLAATRSTAAEQLQVPAAQAPVAERRICSILFVDLVGFTPL